MANGYFERGEIYNIRMDNGIGSEEGSYRPGVIVSSPEGNKTAGTVLVAYLTTRFTNLSINMETMATGRRSYVMGNQIATVDKGRLKPTPMGTLSSGELNRLDEILEEVFDLGYVDDVALAEKDKEIEKLKAEIAELTGEVAKWQGEIIKKKAAHEDELLSYKVENAMWQKCYERSLDQLVKMKVTADIAVRAGMPPKTPVVEELSVAAPVEETPEAEDLPDINSCSATALKKIGFGVGLARATIQARPFDNVEDLKRVPGMSKTKFGIFKQKVCCRPMVAPVDVVEPEVVTEPEVPVVSEKVNVNTATWKELVEVVGMTRTVALAVTGKRKRNGPYKKLEDLLYEGRFTQYHLDKYGPMLEVG